MTKREIFEVALEILKNHSYCIDDLPSEVGSLLWQLLQTQLGLSIGQLSSLQNFVVENQKSASKSLVVNKKSSGCNKRKTKQQSNSFHDDDIISIRDTDDASAANLDEIFSFSPPKSASSTSLSKKLFDYSSSGGNKKKKTISLDHFLDMDYKKVQEIGCSSSSSSSSSFKGNETTFSSNNNKSFNNTNSGGDIKSESKAASSSYPNLGKVFPYTTAIHRQLFLLQYLRMNPLDADEEMYLAKKHGIKDVEVLTFPHDARFVLPENGYMSDSDDMKYTYLQTDPFVADLIHTENYQLSLRTHIPANLNGEGDWPYQLDSYYPISLMELISSNDPANEKRRQPIIDLLFAKYFFKH
eukprot:CAMPEP_0170075422 /NCGR_PEP_ID=MMETSP0019_2-20121128/12560_1 /TAXON_ID=98059 /ORGANISM="Dinobryon sp., Strain UTEXLB2267" /LENGTH=354 /DNA_ID=CAMNT_0010286377 /DNA_START=28 /DNA_END=1093 /DNA_ORIENTATION=-